MQSIRRSNKISIMFLFLVALFSGGATYSQEKSSQREPIGVMAEGYLNNREAFSFLTCRFLLKTGTSKSVASALKGDIDKPIISKGLWIYHNDKAKYELICDENVLKDALAKPSSNGAVYAPCITYGYLTDGNITLKYNPSLNSANIWDACVGAEALRKTPFAMGIMGDREERSPGVVLREALSGKLFFRFDGMNKKDGYDVMVARVGLKPDQLGAVYFMAVNYGFLPVFISSKSSAGIVTFQNTITSIRQCSKGRWFPARSVMVTYPDQQPPYHVQEISVVSLDVDTPPALTEFFLDLPPRIQISEDLGEKLSMTHTKTAERIHLRDLSSLLERTRQGGEDQLAMEKRWFSNSAPQFGKTWHWLMLCGVIAILAYLFAAKRKHRS